MVGGKSFIDIRHPEDIDIAKISKDPFSFVIDKISCSLPAWIFDIKLAVLSSLQHSCGTGNGTCRHGSI
jgi:hypothetical protein